VLISGNRLVCMQRVGLNPAPRQGISMLEGGFQVTWFGPFGRRRSGSKARLPCPSRIVSCQRAGLLKCTLDTSPLRLGCFSLSKQRAFSQYRRKGQEQE
jgi:hypothetical protein